MWIARRGVSLLLLVGLTLASASPASALRPPEHASYARVRAACPPPSATSASCFALLRVPVPAAQAGAAGVHPLTSGGGARRALGTGPAEGFTPAELAHAYGYDRNAAAGTGQTVAVVDAFDDPNIEADLAKFDSHYGLEACTTANGCFRKLNQEGHETPLPAADVSGWSVEIALDVETVRAVCNGCHILLVEAKNAEYKNLAAAVAAAVAHHATEVSNSYGGPEGDLGSAEASAYNDPGVVVTAATGDLGWDDWNYLLASPNSPASLPTVVSVGGTSLELNAEGRRSAETVWNDDGFFDKNRLEAGYVTGGGCSAISAADPWQRDAAGYAAAGCGAGRLSADVAADADPLTGFDIYDDFNYCGTAPECKELIEAIKLHGGWETLGGTSLSSPMIASMYGLAGGSAGLRYPALTLYAHLGDASALYDVTQGGSGACDGFTGTACSEEDREVFLETGANVDCEGTTACDAAVGLDGPSGVGAPDGLTAFGPLFPAAQITLPPEIVAGVPATLSAASSRDPNPGATFSSWSWSFGDGTPKGAVSNPSHTFAAPGEYTLTLSVVDDYGLASVPVTVVAKVITRSEAEAKAKLEKEEEEARKRAESRAQSSGATPAGGGGGPAAGVGVSAFQVSAPAPLARLARTSLRASRSGRVVIHLSCPAGVSTCAGTITLRLRAVGTRRRPRTMLVTGAFSIASGGTGTVVLHLSGTQFGLLERTRTLHGLAVVDSRLPGGGSHAVTSTVTLEASARRRRSG